MTAAVRSWSCRSDVDLGQLVDEPRVHAVYGDSTTSTAAGSCGRAALVQASTNVWRGVTSLWMGVK
jgi:hypothetical protein